MACTREEKEAIVRDVTQAAGRAQSLVAAEYRGMNVAELTRLRRRARDCGVEVRVVKNNLAKRALEGTDYACARERLVGPLLLGFSERQPMDGPRLFRDFGRENELLRLRFGAMDGAVLDVPEVRKLADLPTRDEALAQLMATLRAPIEKMARMTADIPGRLVRTMAAYRDRRQADPDN